MRIALAFLMLLAAPGFAAETATRGRYYYGAEVESFHPCGSNKAYWVVGEEEMLKPLRDRTDQLRKPHRAYPPIYVEFFGEVDEKAKREGFAEDYDALFHVRKIVRVSNIAPKDCPMRANNTVERDARKSGARPSP